MRKYFRTVYASVYNSWFNHLTFILTIALFSLMVGCGSEAPEKEPPTPKDPSGQPGTQTGKQPPKEENQKLFVPDHILVKPKADADPALLKAFHAKNRAGLLRIIKPLNIQVVQLPKGSDHHNKDLWWSDLQIRSYRMRQEDVLQRWLR